MRQFRWLIIGLALLVGCGGSEPWERPGPRETFQTFLMDLWRGNQESAFEALRPELREVLSRPLEDLDGKLDQRAMPRPEEMLVVARLDSPFSIHRIEVDTPVRETPEVGHRVTLTLQYHDERTGQAALIWGGDRWYVDLPEPRRTPVLVPEGDYDNGPLMDDETENE
ncbi:MAG: hypothetical protein ACNA8W_20475 [Bradymonadaceae bacterium]